VIIKPWTELSADEFFDIVRLREQIFFLEQHIDEEELDDQDRAPETLHLWIPDEHGVAAYLRVVEAPEPEFEDARRSFGRVVVRADRRGEGLAQRLIDVVVDRFGREAMLLHAQEYIVPLYEKYAFERFGDVYVEAGLPHILMYRPAAA
jgi:ElaA protein